MASLFCHAGNHRLPPFEMHVGDNGRRNLGAVIYGHQLHSVMGSIASRRIAGLFKTGEGSHHVTAPHLDIAQQGQKLRRVGVMFQSGTQNPGSLIHSPQPGCDG